MCSFVEVIGNTRFESWTLNELISNLEFHLDIKVPIKQSKNNNSCFCAEDPEEVLSLAGLKWTIEEDSGNWIVKL